MRRMLLSAFALAFLSLLAGCKHGGHWHGVCDCDHDDMCCTRQPWLMNGPSHAVMPDAAPTTGPITMPAASEVVPPQRTSARPSGL